MTSWSNWKITKAMAPWLVGILVLAYLVRNSRDTDLSILLVLSAVVVVGGAAWFDLVRRDATIIRSVCELACFSCGVPP